MIVPRKDSAGNKRWGVRLQQDGKRIWLGTFDTKKEARQAESDARSAKKKHGGPTVGQFARRWLQEDCPRTSGRKLKSDTLRAYRQYMKSVIDEFDDVLVTDVTRDQAFKWALENRSSLQYAQALFAHALDLGLVDSNPFASLRLQGSRGRKDTAPPTKEALSALLGACEAFEAYGPTLRAFITFQAYTGLRPGETFELKWSDIEGDRIHVTRRLGQWGSVDLPKSGVGRTVVLPPPARDALRSFPRGLDYVFRSVRGQRLSHTTMQRYWNKLREESGLDVQLYELRHFAAHHMYVTMGLPARVVAVQLGHRDGGRLVESLYGHGYTDALDRIQDAWASHG